MTDEPALNLEDVMQLVADAMQVSMLGIAPSVGATDIVARRHPSVRLIAAAKRENLEVHGGATPEPLRSLVPPSPIPGDIARLRRAIDDVLNAVERLVSGSQ